MMPEITTAEVRAFLKTVEGQEISLDHLRNVFNLEKGTKSYAKIDPIIFELVDRRLLRRTSRGWLMVIKPVLPVQVFGVERERRPPFELIFPRDYGTMMEMDFANDVVIREGDMVIIDGVKSGGKTTLCMNFCGENIDKYPILMGNEYTIIVEQTEKHPSPHDVAPRFLSRLDTMDVANGGWINWRDKEGKEKFTLLPVWADYAEHIVKNKINIIDWINLPGEYYLISPILEAIKRSLGRGIAIVSLQKNPDKSSGRGGAMVSDFADLELLLDGFGEGENILLTIKGAKEKHSPIVGKTYAYSISEGVKIHNFREMKKCPECRGTGYKTGKLCEMCYGLKFIDKT